MALLHNSNIPVLDSTSPPPNLFDGTTRLYINFISPFAQRAWIARNFKGLDQIELVGINLGDKPSWYVEKVYSIGKVPALEHNGKVIGESLDILEYFEQNFDGPPLFPQDPSKKEAAKALLKYSDEFIGQCFKMIGNKETTTADVVQDLGPYLDHLEAALGKFEHEGPFFMGPFGGVDLAYAPLLERIEPVVRDVFDYDVYDGRPRLSNWSKAINTIDAYTITKCEPKSLVQIMKKVLGR